MSDTPAQSQEMQAFLKDFSEELHPVILQAAIVEKAYGGEYEEYLKHGYNMAELQKPKYARICGSDPRTMQPYESAYGAGEVLVHRATGAQTDTADGTLLKSAEVFYELAAAYGVPAVETEMHNDTLAMHWLRVYHSSLDGERQTIEERGPGFAQMAASRGNLYNRVKNRLTEQGGFAVYEKMGIDLVGTNDEKFETCLAIEQAVWNSKALRAKADHRAKEHAEDHHVPAPPEPILIFKDLFGQGKSYAYDEKAALFRMIPAREEYKDEAAYKAALDQMLRGFVPAVHDPIRKASQAQSHYRDEMAKLIALGYSLETMRELAMIARASCSDSRVTDPYLAAVGVGKIISYRNPGNFGSCGDGKVLPQMRQTLEACVAYGISTFVIEQHSGCGAMKSIYAFNNELDGEDYVGQHYGVAFKSMGRERAGLYNRTVKMIQALGFRHYEDMGIKLYGDVGQKVQTCMAIEQGLVDRRVIAELKKEDPRIPTPVLTFKHLHEKGRMYIFDSTHEKFRAIPALDGDIHSAKLQVEPKRGTRPQKTCSCGRGHGCGH